MPQTTPEQEARLEVDVRPLERAALEHRQNKETEQCLRLQREALTRREAIVGPVDESLAEGITWLANDLRDEGQYEEAEALFLRALAICEELYGPSSLEVAEELFWIGCLYDDWERYEMSLPIYHRALAIEETLCGKVSPEAAATCTWLGDAHVELSQYAQAEPYFQRATLIWRTQQALEGTEHLALVLERLAGTLFRLKRYAEAAAAYQNVLALNDDKFWEKQSRRRFKTSQARCAHNTVQGQAAEETRAVSTTIVRPAKQGRREKRGEGGCS